MVAIQTNRERFVRVFAGEEVDHIPFLDVMGFWDSCLARWKKKCGASTRIRA